MKLQFSCLIHFSPTITGALLCAFLFLACGAGVAQAQQVVVDLATAPPPLRFIPNEDQTQLNVARDGKARTRLSLELCEARLLQAEKFTGEKKFERAATELGIYQALVEDSFRYLNSESTGSNKFRDLFRRLEQTLRLQDARIQAMRRLTPAIFGVNLQATSEALRRVRTNALNAFFGEGTVNDSLGAPEDLTNTDSHHSPAKPSPDQSPKDQ
ncbi:MAG: hypothetical protein H0V88_08305 [Pyrinomonadaceae bacterium]|nr:hypothetical protein [Pyrinomonadaceae bacterium]